jgi:hypothetical protein
MKKLELAFIVFVSAAPLVRAGDLSEPSKFSDQEQALLKKDLIMEIYAPTKHSGHEAIDDQKGGAVLFIFGMEDAAVARKLGREVAQLPSDIAEKRVRDVASKRYHGDPFLMRCFAQEAKEEAQRAYAGK